MISLLYVSFNLMCRESGKKSALLYHSKYVGKRRNERECSLRKQLIMVGVAYSRYSL